MTIATTYLKYLETGFFKSFGRWYHLIFWLFLCFLLVGGGLDDSTILAYTAFRACELLDLIIGPFFRLKEQCLCDEETQSYWDQHVDHKVS